MKHPALIITLILLLVTCACTGTQSTNGGESVTDTLSSSQISVESESTHTPEGATRSSVEQTATSIPEQPTSTPTTTPGPTPSLPASTEHDLFLKDLLFESETPDCNLPCWQGIIPGESTEEEVYTILQAIFGIDLSEEQRCNFGITRLTSEELALQYFTKPYRWRVSSTEEATFHLRPSFEQSSEMLELLQFSWNTRDSAFYQFHLSALDVIRELGEPSHMAAYAETYGRADFGAVGLLLVYSQGVVFEFFYDSMVFTTSPAGTQVEICLGTNEVGPHSNIGGIVGDFYLMRPIPADLNKLSPLQASVVRDLLELHNYAPVEEIFQLDSETIASQASIKEDVCLTTVIND